eukprot:5090307-Pyramimonas_sp.AAC.1
MDLCHNWLRSRPMTRGRIRETWKARSMGEGRVRRGGAWDVGWISCVANSTPNPQQRQFEIPK